MTNPCFCGCSLKTASLIIGIIDMVFAALLGVIVAILGGISIGALAGATAKGDQDQETYATALGLMIAVVVVSLLICFGKFYLGLLLKRGSDQEDLRKCRIWFIVSAVLLVLGVLTNIASGLIIATVFGILYELFCLWVVYEFMCELKAGETYDGTTTNNAGHWTRLRKSINLSENLELHRLQKYSFTHTY